MTEPLPRTLQEFIVDRGIDENIQRVYATEQATAQQEPAADDSVDLSPDAEARIDLLAKAAFTVSQDRNERYGEPVEHFTKVGVSWSAYLGLDVPIHPADVAAMMVIFKTMRLSSDPAGYDSWLDIAGYAACGGALFISEGES